MTAHFLIAILWLAVASTPTPYPLSAHAQIDTRETFGPLKFNADGSFQISIFEDLHFGESMHADLFSSIVYVPE